MYTTVMNIHTATIPVFIKNLNNLLRLMAKGEKFAKEKKFDVSVILQTRLAPDQFNFIQQVQYMYYIALDVAVGFSGEKMPTFAYTETTMEELKISVKRVIVFLQTIRPEHLKDAEERMVPYFFNKKKLVRAETYLSQIGFPNFFFHYTLSYEILRHIGVPIGIADFTGPLPGLK